MTEPVTIEYAGWLPTFQRFGNCGHHPQFSALSTPPVGYKFIQSDYRTDTIPLRRRSRRLWRGLLNLPKVTFSILRLIWVGYRHDMNTRDIIEFLRSRDIWGQLMLPTAPFPVFLPSVPFIYGQHPWLLEVEDVVSILFPEIHNGETQTIENDKIQSLPLIRELLLSPSCLGVITHMNSTALAIPKLFNAPELADKVIHVPFGIPLPPKRRPQSDGGPLRLMFTGSWHQGWDAFYTRGAPHILRAFAALRQKIDLKLVMRCSIPPNVPDDLRAILEDENVTVIDHFISDSEMNTLWEECDVFLLPSARIHVVSLLQAMAREVAVIVTDGWGFSEYVTADHDAVVIHRDKDAISSMDNQSGMLRENYEHCKKHDEGFDAQLAEKVLMLAQNASTRQRLAHNARHTVETKYNLEAWNAGLQSALEKTVGKSDPQ